VIQTQSSLGHHLFQVPIAERIAQIPTKAEVDPIVWTKFLLSLDGVAG
jgi:hypothetical protein